MSQALAVDQTDQVESAVESHLSSYFGRRMRSHSSKELFPGKTKSRGIRYIVYRCDNNLEVFVKYARKLRVNPSLELQLSNVPGLTVPLFFGSGQVNGSTFAIWERTAYPHFKAFERATATELFAIVDCIVALNCATGRISRLIQGVPIRTPWVQPRSDEIRKSVIEFSERGARVDDLEKRWFEFCGFESDVLARFQRVGDRFLAHNDIANHNILRAPDGGLVLVDWELAMISAPGTSLRGFAVLDDGMQRELAKYYSAQMTRCGHPTDERDTFFVMGAVQTYFKISMALAKNSPDLLREALDLAPSLIGSRL